ncbi:ATP-binding protein [Gordonia phosphorivorans]|uniref:histidine kinase n=1 Tax=Gordonia phosphorivorans TaxID=1056982 RepID=A0ABV6HBB3_9ACTN
MSTTARRLRPVAADDLHPDDTAVLLERQMEVLELVAAAAPVERVLEAIIVALEGLMPGARCSILLVDPADGTLRHGAAPSLPADYLRAIDGLRPGPAAGSCGTAAYRGEPVVIPDLRVDHRWQRFRAVARDAGLVACWSTPITAPRGGIVGTFAVYHGRPHEPSDRDRGLVDRFTYIAAVAIEHSLLVGEVVDGYDAAEASRQAHREAEVARRIAEDHCAAKSALLTSVSHEIRTPLQAIKGFAELLCTLDLDAPRRAEALARINTAADHLLSLVTDVLDISRAEANALPVRLEAVRVGRSVREVVELTSSLAADRGVSVTSAIATDDRIVADADRLRQVLLNLVGNAIHHGRRGGNVEIASATTDRAVTVRITDDGPGIPEDFLPRIFTPFARADDTGGTAAPVDGNGLGLMLAHGLVTAMGGELWAGNAADGGAVFTLTLPRQDGRDRSDGTA